MSDRIPYGNFRQYFPENRKIMTTSTTTTHKITDEMLSMVLLTETPSVIHLIPTKLSELFFGVVCSSIKSSIEQEISMRFYS